MNKRKHSETSEQSDRSESNANQVLGDQMTKIKSENALVTRAARIKKAKLIAGVTPPQHSEQPADDISELRRLVREHAATKKKALAIESMVSSRIFCKTPGKGSSCPDCKTLRKIQKDGTALTTRTTIGACSYVPCTLPEIAQTTLRETAECLHKEADKLVTRPGGLRDILRRQPVWQEFLRLTPGLAGSWVIGSYLIGFIDIRHGGRDGQPTKNGVLRELRDPVATKLSHIIRYCGYAGGRDTEGNQTGKLERPTAGVKLGYNADLRTRLYQWASVLIKGGATWAAGTKYYKLYTDTKHRGNTDPRYGMKQKPDGSYVNGLVKGAKAAINSKAWMKMVHLLLEDLYIVWRTLESLPVWPSYYSAKLGYVHGGMPTASKYGPGLGPKLMMLPEALALVGLAGAAPAADISVDNADTDADDFD